MIISYRSYTPLDFASIQEWFQYHGMNGFTPDFVPRTTYIATYGSRPIASLSLITTNVTEYAHLENLVADPHISAELRRKAVAGLVNYIESQAKSMGYKKLMCLAPNDKLEKRYSELGYSIGLKGLTSMVKEIA